ncbi:MAG: hypothetical protein KJ970_03175 [Candidatus Eisenbacteria bacterium]|uniref:Uncharacterized protein n=1 Tax=Eiseniibacteriota bacterium TaxID=2212470 RepID=A0A948WBF3_UNCEI|nr:hypothetical protein [Candidatus Eisenbacteria bacterium]MBU1950025.1 hypothetical protein [Candidatus Eisenbacteria bacterium]MBU2689903.1 hypothetical protein [Candidatus Eisenbacteria bacterium]
MITREEDNKRDLVMKPLGYDIRLVIFVTTVIFMAIAILLWNGAGVETPTPSVPFSTLAFWFFLSLAAETFWLPAFGKRGMVSMSLAANIAVLFVLPRVQALSITFSSVLLADLILHRRGAIRAVFNGAQSSFSLALAGIIFDFFIKSSGATGSQLLLLCPLAVLITFPVFVLSNSLLVSIAIALEAGKPLGTTWRENYGNANHLVSCAVLFLLGLGLILAVETVGFISGFASLLFIFVIRNAYKYQIRRRQALPSSAA